MDFYCIDSHVGGNFHACKYIDIGKVAVRFIQKNETGFALKYGSVCGLGPKFPPRNVIYFTLIVGDFKNMENSKM